MLLLTAVGVVLLGFSLVGEVRMYTKDDMLIHLLDRVEALEKYRENAA